MHLHRVSWRGGVVREGRDDRTRSIYNYHMARELNERKKKRKIQR